MATDGGSGAGTGRGVGARDVGAGSGSDGASKASDGGKAGAGGSSDNAGKAGVGGDRPQKRKRNGAARCPICKAPTARKFRPFCSKRCADVDLGRWLTGAYAIPGHPDAEEDGEPAAALPGDDPHAEEEN